MQLTSTIWASGVQVQLHHGSVRRVDAGVVDQHVRAAEDVDRSAHSRCAVLGVVSLPRHCHFVLGSAERHRLAQGGFPARSDEQAGALGDESLGEADVSARSGDDRGAVVQLLGHADSN